MVTLLYPEAPFTWLLIGTRSQGYLYQMLSYAYRLHNDTTWGSRKVWTTLLLQNRIGQGLDRNCCVWLIFRAMLQQHVVTYGLGMTTPRLIDNIDSGKASLKSSLCKYVEIPHYNSSTVTVSSLELCCSTPLSSDIKGMYCDPPSSFHRKWNSVLPITVSDAWLWMTSLMASFRRTVLFWI